MSLKFSRQIQAGDLVLRVIRLYIIFEVTQLIKVMYSRENVRTSKVGSQGKISRARLHLEDLQKRKSQKEG